jgi:WD40 repeat protein
MQLTLEQMTLMSRLLDEALALSESERRSWLETLPPDLRPLSEALRRALLTPEAAHTGLERLNTLPKLDAADSGGRSGLQPGRAVGPYELLRPLGAGGMAEVWLARRTDGALKRAVALKLPLVVRPDLRQRLVRERDILAGLEHPHIARLYDAGVTAEGQPYLALEYVAGTPLTTYCDEQRLDLRQRLELFRQVLDAVQYAHAHLVIHRDLKPSNILVGDGQVHLLDFGIAKLLSDGQAKETQLTQMSGRALTPDYAAPEQITGAPVTTAADIYSLGVLLYELIVGERPYRLKRDSRGALEEAILSAEPVAPSHLHLGAEVAAARGTTGKKLVRAFRGDLDTIVLKALRKVPGERYATASEFSEDIGRFLSGEVVLAQRQSLLYVLGKFARRYRMALAGIALLLATLAAGLAATSYEATVALKQRDATERAQLRSLTQTASARLGAGDVPAGLSLILEVLPQPGVAREYTAEALGVFQQARANDAQLLALTGDGAAVVAAAYAPDGRRIVSASTGGSAVVWDADTGLRQLTLTGHSAAVLGAQFSPDGRRIATASADKSARIWDAATGRELLRLVGHTGTVWSVAFSPDGRRVVTASRDRTARIWDAASGAQLGVLSGHTDVVHSARFSPDGQRIVTASYDKSARIWDAATGRVLQTLSGHTDDVLHAAFSGDGRQVVTASVDATARTWDAQSGRQLLLIAGHNNWVADAAFSPDGRQIATASYDRTVRLWDAATGAPLRLFSGHTHWVASVGFSPDGTRLVSAAHDATVRTWDLEPARQLLRITGHEGWVAAAAYTPDGARLLSAGSDRTARFWEASTGAPLAVLRGHTDLVNTVRFTRDGRRVVTSSNDRTARVWDALTARPLLTLAPNPDDVEDANFSPDGRRIVTSAARVARIWDSISGRLLMELQGHTDSVFAAVYSPDGARILTSSWDKTARIWNATTGRQMGVLTGHTGRLVGAAFSPDGRRVVTASHDKTARIWNAATGQEQVLLAGHRDVVETAVFSPDGRYVVTAADDQTVRLWDAATGWLLALYDIQGGPVFSAEFSPDGRRIVTAASDRTLRVFDASVAALPVQLSWAQAAQFDGLTPSERFELGLQPAADVRAWLATASPCDQAAADSDDPDRLASGMTLASIQVDPAQAACVGAKTARGRYQLGRVHLAQRQLPLARADFEAALAGGYRSAGTDLARLLLRPDAGPVNITRALALYAQAWQRGVPVAGYELAQLYARGVGVTPDQTVAGSWLQRAAQAGEPHALAQLGEQAETRAVARTVAAQQTILLEAFGDYAAAAERARLEDWPEQTWLAWRYRRASLARLLARQGQMRAVALRFDAIRKQYQPQAHSWWRPGLTVESLHSN